jgi:hypothetical protein
MVADLLVFDFSSTGVTARLLGFCLSRYGYLTMAHTQSYASTGSRMHRKIHSYINNHGALYMPQTYMYVAHMTETYPMAAACTLYMPLMCATVHDAA